MTNKTGKPSPEAIACVLAVIEQHATGISVAECARVSGVNEATVAKAAYWLRADGLVMCKKHGMGTAWATLANAQTMLAFVEAARLERLRETRAREAARNRGEAKRERRNAAARARHAKKRKAKDKPKRYEWPRESSYTSPAPLIPSVWALAQVVGAAA